MPPSKGTSSTLSIGNCIKKHGLLAADRIGDTASVASFSKRALQYDDIIRNTDAFNNGFTYATAWIGSLCYITAGLALYLDKRKFYRTENKIKAGMLFTAGIQNASLVTYNVTTMALPSFIFNAMVDLVIDFNTMLSAYKKTTIEGWLEDTKYELEILQKLNHPEDKEEIQRLTRIVNNNKLTQRAYFINEQDALKKNLHKCLLNFIGRAFTLAGLILLKIAIFSVALQPLIMLACLGIGAAVYASRTYDSFKELYYFKSPGKTPSPPRPSRKLSLSGINTFA